MVTDECEVFYAQIIDFLTVFSGKKKAEVFFKSIRYDKTELSVTPPDFYALRFVKFLNNIFVSRE
jgi:hypothetical protein